MPSATPPESDAPRSRPTHETDAPRSRPTHETDAPRSRPRRRTGVALAAALAAALFAGACGTADGDGAADGDVAGAATTSPSFDPAAWHGPVLPEPLVLPDLVLTDTAGETFDLRAETLGDPTLLFFGYTHCPDICPIHMSTIARAMENVGLTTDDLDVVFVTNDPDRDTPEAMETFLDRFDEGFVGLTGDIDTIVAAMDDLGLPPPEYSEPTEDGAYFVGHAAQVIAFDAAGESRIVYPFGVEMAAWEADLPKLVAGEQPHV